MNAPLYLSRPGYIIGGSLSSAGGSGRYWSSTVNSSEHARNLYFHSSLVNPENYDGRYVGFSLRCVLREITYSVVGTGPNNDNTIPNGIDLTGSQNVGYTPNAFTTIMNTHPLYFMLSGSLGGSRLYNFVVGGSYWSSTASSFTYAYGLYFSSGELYPANHYDRSTGRSLRCLSR